MKVKDFMIRDVISVQASITVKELLNLLVQHRIGGVPVVDSENKLLGMISDGDIIRHLAPREEAVHDLFFSVYVEKGETEKDVLEREINKGIDHVMHKRHIYTVREEDDFDKVIRILSHHHFKKLPVVNSEERVVGVISRGDIVHHLVKVIAEL